MLSCSLHLWLADRVELLDFWCASRGAGVEKARDIVLADIVTAVSDELF